MRTDQTQEFPLLPGLTMFNHASYGLATVDLLARAEQVRRELERDPNVTLGEALQERLAEALGQVCAGLGLDPRFTALTTSATAGAAALQRSLPLSAGDVVLSLDCEYSSILRGWQRRCDEVGAELRVVPVDLPLTGIDVLLDSLTTAAGDDPIAVLQFSAITSSAALALPVQLLAAWGHAHGATVLVDAAHAPGHIDIAHWGTSSDGGPDAMFGTIHKWFPVPRSVGILWTKPELAELIHPAETSLTFDDADLARRFAWPGTFDPAVRLCVGDAIAVHTAWTRSGQIEHCEKLADHLSHTLTRLGARPTAGEGLLPPRMRAFLLPGVPAATVRARLLEADIRAWTGSHGDHTSLLRLATHVYNDEDDVDRLAHEVQALLPDHSVAPCS